MSEQDRLPSPPDDEIAGLLERARPRMRGLLARFRIPPSEGEDLVQEACISLLRHWGKIEHPEAWLLHVLYWGCCGHLRRQRQALLQYLDAALLEDLAPEQRPAQERAEQLLDLNRLAALLPRRYQLLLHLRYRLGLSSDEIAARLGYQAASIGSLSLRALARVRASLTQQAAARRLRPHPTESARKPGRT